jgi:hypothetical protein
MVSVFTSAGSLAWVPRMARTKVELDSGQARVGLQRLHDRRQVAGAVRVLHVERQLLALADAGAGASLRSSSDVATQGVSADVAAASSALNSTIRRFAGGVGGQFGMILLASYAIAITGTPRFAAFTVAYLVAAVLCLAGAVLVTSRRR